MVKECDRVESQIICVWRWMYVYMDRLDRKVNKVVSRTKIHTRVQPNKPFDPKPHVLQGIESDYQHVDAIPHFRRGSEADRHVTDHTQLDRWYKQLEKLSPNKTGFDFATPIPGVGKDGEGSFVRLPSSLDSVDTLKRIEDENKCHPNPPHPSHHEFQSK